MCEKEQQMEVILAQRKEVALFRSLSANEGRIDFCSNDYLSFARNLQLQERVYERLQKTPYLSGATGSRSISGHTRFVETLESKIAFFHQAEAGLIFNSGFDANLGLFSCIAEKGDTLICDELIHASIIDGCRLSYTTRYRFAHNDLAELEGKLSRAHGQIFVAVESVYSMDGDLAPLEEIATLCAQYHAHLIVDEAHATGVFGQKGSGRVQELGLQFKVFARVHTFGKALGCHGAIVLGSKTLKDYLINFARPFIFTTALPMHSLITIQIAYEAMGGNAVISDPVKLHSLIELFRNHYQQSEGVYLIDSISPIQSVVIPGNKKVKFVASLLQENNFEVRAIVSPSVPVGKERLRISLHLHNSPEEVKALLDCLHEILNYA